MDSMNRLKDKLQAYAKDRLQLLASTLDRARTTRLDAFCCLSLDWRGISLAYLKKTDNVVQLEFIETVACDLNNPLAELWGLVKKHNLEDVSCSWMLNQNQYHLLIHEDIPVKEEEFQAAVRWQVRKLLPFPADEAYIDSFPIPPAEISNPKKMIMIVAAQKKIIDPAALQIADSGLNLVCIDIQELAFRNVAAFYENDEGATALLYVKEKTSELIITRKKLFYFSRRFDWGYESLSKATLNDESVQNYLAKLALEVRRSFDYFQNQWRVAAPKRIIVVSGHDNLSIAEYLGQRLQVECFELDLNKTISARTPLLPVQQYQHLPIIGGVYMNEIDYETTN